MPSNNNLLQQINTSETLAAKLAALFDQLETELHTFFEKSFGFPMPNLIQSEVNLGSSMVIYSTEFDAASITAQARQALGGTFSEPQQESVVTAGVNTVTTLIGLAVPQGEIEIGLKYQGGEVTDPWTEKELTVAALSNASLQTASQWGVSQDFNVFWYSLVVFDKSQLS